mgnify:CR=1 FL=1
MLSACCAADISSSSGSPSYKQIRKFNQVLGNLENILAVELMFAAQGLEFRRPAKCSKIVEENYDIIRSVVPKLENDREIGKDMIDIADLIRNRKLVVN